MPPGKFAPKLYQDLLAFDPIKGKPNILTEHARPVGEGPQLAPLPGSCKHDYTVKSEQSVTPPLDLRPDEAGEYKVAVVCKKCRIHASVFIDCSNSKIACPINSQSPLHHFTRVATHDLVATERIQFAWHCSAHQCEARLLVGYRLPRLSEDDYDLLLDLDLLRARYDALVEQDPEREGIRLATPMDALFRLRRYIKDSLQPGQTRRQFPANNKRFQEAFGLEGRDCAALLERFGFKYANGSWDVPLTDPLEDRLSADGHTLRERCEDVTYELLAYMFKLSSEQQLVNPAAGEGWSSANRDLEITLAAQGYPRWNPALRRTAVINETVPYFNSLGALPDFSDSLIEHAYDRQVLCDPGHIAYYFECLQAILDLRNTEQLQTKVVTLQSTGLYSRRDLNAAYRFLNINVADANLMSDQRILEQFQAQQCDLGSEAQEEARAALYKIGVSRQSSQLINASQQAVDTYEDALMWLGNGVNKSTSDEGLLAVVAMKSSESASNDEIAQKAISTIAKARKSNMLNNWLLTGRTDGWTMSVDEALRHLNIDQPFDTIDQTILPALFDSARQDRPGENTNRAIATIEQAMAVSAGATQTPDTWPVGLTSHGNTCYLNSLLQYYFSIKPLRDIILSYDNYKLDTATHKGKEERVGQRKISMVEIKGGQRFADGLRELFERMIVSPDSAVRPAEDLVCRAFLEPKDYALMAPNMEEIMADTSSSALDANGTLVGSPVEEKMEDTPANPEFDRKLSMSSSTTLQASQNGDSPDVIMNDTDASSTSPNLQQSKPTTTVAPHTAPPLPPRRFSTTKEEALSKAQENARQQQDVTEVHDNIMFRLRSGMMPRDTDGDGEQKDALRDLFSIGIIETAVNKGVLQKSKDLSDTSVQLNVPYEATDIYTALDDVFDLQSYAGNPSLETFKSIGSLPPLLQINIPRIGFDKNRVGGAVYKSNECVRLHDKLYLDRYFQPYQQDLMPKRKECWEWRKKLRLFQREKKVLSEVSDGIGLDAPSAMAESAKYLASLDAVNSDLVSLGMKPIEGDGEITQTLTIDAQTQGESLNILDGDIATLKRQIDQQFEDNKICEYRLAAVFFHRGGPGHGHYWIYIHDFQNGIWRSYNDERVEEFKKMDDIFEAKSWQQGTPTYAVYVAANSLDLIQAVCRVPERPPTPEYAPPPPLETITEDNVDQGVPRFVANPSREENPTTESSNPDWDSPRYDPEPMLTDSSSSLDSILTWRSDMSSFGDSPAFTPWQLKRAHSECSGNSAIGVRPVKVHKSDNTACRPS